MSQYTVSINYIPQTFTVEAGSVGDAEVAALELAGDPANFRIVSTHAWG